MILAVINSIQTLIRWVVKQIFNYGQAENNSPDGYGRGQYGDGGYGNGGYGKYDREN